MSDSAAASVAVGEGWADLRAVVGAYSCGQVDDVDLVEALTTLLVLDVRGKPDTTVYVRNTGAEPASILLSWWITDISYSETVVVGSGLTVITPLRRVAHRLSVGGSSVDGTKVDVAACATI